jgi:hypothetical protein
MMRLPHLVHLRQDLILEVLVPVIWMGFLQEAQIVVYFHTH